MSERDEVWTALEWIIAEELQVRKDGLQKLVELQALQKYPLAVYVVSSRIVEPDLTLRADIIRALAVLRSLELKKGEQSEDVLYSLYNYFSRIQDQQIYDLLQVVNYDTSLFEEVSFLIGLSSYADEYLVNLIAIRKNPLDIRLQSLKIIENEGYENALPELKRILARLERKTKPNSNHITEPRRLVNDRILIEALKEAIGNLED